MSSLIPKSRLFEINGVVDTNNNILQNINDITQAGIGFLTYDIGLGAWSVTNNEPGLAVANFNNSNIIGEINVSGLSIDQLFNSVTIEFPHVDIKGRTDFIDLDIPSSERFNNELDNRLNLKNPLISDPIQAQYIAGLELKQNRLDKIVEFKTDYTRLGLKAGDIITLTNDVYGFDNKQFRIIKVEEDDSESLILNFTALEYDESIYDSSNLTRNFRSDVINIPPIILNEQIAEIDAIDAGAQLQRLLLANAGLAALNKLFKRVAGNIFEEDTESDVSKLLNNEELLEAFNDESIATLIKSLKVPSLTTIQGPNSVCAGTTVNINVSHSCSVCIIDLTDTEYPYTITGVDEEDIGIPLSGTLLVLAESQGASGTLVIPTTSVIDASKTMVVDIGGLTKSVVINKNIDTAYNVTASAGSIDEGQSVTINITSVDVPNGTSVPYEITGSAIPQVTTALTGNITINNNAASITIDTVSNTDRTDDLTLTFTISPTFESPCRPASVLSVSVTVIDLTPAPPPDPPPPPPDTQCEYVLVPMTWCGTYDGTDSELKSMTALSSINLPVPLAGEATITVPLTVSVTKGNPSTIAVTSTATVASAALQAAMGGRSAQIITSFDPVPPNGLIKGTVLTVYGY